MGALDLVVTTERPPERGNVTTSIGEQAPTAITWPTSSYGEGFSLPPPPSSAPSSSGAGFFDAFLSAFKPPATQAMTPAQLQQIQAAQASKSNTTTMLMVGGGVAALVLIIAMRK
ncbi:MAG: hypothetical protein ABIO35_10920 [Nitrobacter sp.]